MFQHSQPAQPPAAFGQKLRRRARRGAILGEDKDAAAFGEMQAQRIERAGVEAQRRAFGNRPAEPCGCEAEGAGGGRRTPYENSCRGLWLRAV